MVNGSGIDIWANIDINAANNPHKIICLVESFIKLSPFKIYIKMSFIKEFSVVYYLKSINLKLMSTSKIDRLTLI